MIMAADALLHFHSCGVAHLWAAITLQMIQTGPVMQRLDWLSDRLHCSPLFVFMHCPISLHAKVLCTRLVCNGFVTHRVLIIC